jgi:glucose-1-phosphate thymidylyltransferase
MQPLAFSKELLPVGTRTEVHASGIVERPRAVSEYLLERMIRAGATRLCFVISPGKSDILEYYGASFNGVPIVYVVQPAAAGLCDAIFCAAPVIGPQTIHDEDNNEEILLGLPDTVWFPEDGLALLPSGTLAFLLFPVDRPQLFDAVILDQHGTVLHIDVKQPEPASSLVWGAVRMPAVVFNALRALWQTPERRDEYLGTLVNAWLAAGGQAVGIAAGTHYVDTGTPHGFREALRLLDDRNGTR